MTTSPPAARFSGHPLAWIVTLLVGTVLRVLAAFPSFRHDGQSDLTMTGLTAFEILRGDLQVFLFDGTRLGALESYLHLPFFAQFGASRTTLYLAPLLMGVALLAAFAALARELLGPEEGLLALLFLAVPSPAVLVLNILPFGYVETLFFITATLFCATRIVRRGPDSLTALGFGLAAGLGWWGSALSLAGTLPAGLWIVLHRSRLLRSTRCLALAAAGLVAGALPWIAINVRYPLISFQGGSAWQTNFAFQTAGGFDQLASNARRFATEILPALLLRAEGSRPQLLTPAVLLVGAAHATAVLLALLQIASLRPWKGAATEGPRRISPLLLPLLVAGCTGTFFAVSAAGSIPGDVVRYVAPVGLAAPLLLAHLGGWLAARSRATAALLLVTVLGVHFSGSSLPWSPERAAQRRLAHAEDRLLALLAQRHVRWVFGPYWDVYSLNFLSGETIAAIPEPADTDYHGYGRKLGTEPHSFALIFRDPGVATAVARRTGLTGERIDVDGAFEVFVATGSTLPPVRQVQQLRLGLIPDPLPPAAMRSRIEVLEETRRTLRLAQGERRPLRLRIAHAGREAPWVSALSGTPQHAVRLAIRWFRDGVAAAEHRAELPRSLDPGESAEIETSLIACAPTGGALPPGRYEIRIEMVQELVGWFADAGDGRVRLEVEVD